MGPCCGTCAADVGFRRDDIAAACELALGSLVRVVITAGCVVLVHRLRTADRSGSEASVWCVRLRCLKLPAVVRCCGSSCVVRWAGDLYRVCCVEDSTRDVGVMRPDLFWGRMFFCRV